MFGLILIRVLNENIGKRSDGLSRWGGLSEIELKTTDGLKEYWSGHQGRRKLEGYHQPSRRIM